MSAVQKNTSESCMSKAQRNVEWTCVRYPPVPCSTPFGFPVVPDVYRINSGWVLSSSSGSHTADAYSIRSCHMLSLAVILISLFALCSTITCLTRSRFFVASSTICFSLTTFPLRNPPSAVTTIFDPESSILSLIDDALNPEKITV